MVRKHLQILLHQFSKVSIKPSRSSNHFRT
jgi:hypothetical protein